jgi:ion channel-forming bestrophin family protein
VRSVAHPNPTSASGFWSDALEWKQAITRVVKWRVMAFGLLALLVNLFFLAHPWRPISTTHVQYTGGVLVLLLVLRTNAAYDRWWEGRKIWGGIVNQSRNLAIKAMANGSMDDAFRDRFVRWSAAFCHVARRSLRGERDLPELVTLLGAEDAARVAAANHMPAFVALELGRMLREAREAETLDGWAFQEIDRERAILIDHIGACERILRTPLPRVHTIKLRRFILIYLVGLPFMIVTPTVWVCPVVTILVAYPLFAIDQIAQELEEPFSRHRASHLPLDLICTTIEANLLALLEKPSDKPGTPRPA